VNTRIVKTKARRKALEAPQKPVTAPDMRAAERSKSLSDWSAPLPLPIFRRIIE
jgi:hypothetical protein